MLRVADLAVFGPPAELVDVWVRHVQELTDVQEKAVKGGALDGHSNLLVVAPTSSGKTFIGELAATTSAYTKRRHSIFIVPFRALADEHYDLFRERYSGLLSVVVSTADWTEFDSDIRQGNFNLAVMTYEKFAGFISLQPDLLQQCTTLVIDEIQNLSDETRGADLELLITQVMLADNSPQIIGLSASLDDINGLDRWLGANLIHSTERPIPLTQLVCEPGGSAVEYAEGRLTQLPTFIPPRGDRESLTLALALQIVASDQQVIVFRSSINKVAEIAQNLSRHLPAAGVSDGIGTQLNELEDSDILPDLRHCLASKVGFHHADMSHTERRVVEDAFHSGDVRVLVATTTLAMGVNLPCDAVIIADSKRFVMSGTRWGSRNISVSEYRNSAGRAGRLGKRIARQSILIAEHKVEQRQLVNSYLTGPVDPVQSQLPRKPLAATVFALICGKSIDSVEDIVRFISSTFAYSTVYERTGTFEDLRTTVQKSIQDCVTSGLVIESELNIFPTAVARALATTGLSLDTCSRLSRLVEQLVTTQLSTQDLLLEIAACPEFGDRPWLPRDQGFDPRPTHSLDGHQSSPQSRLSMMLRKPELTPDEKRQMLRSRCLFDWMAGKDLQLISAEFRGLGVPGARVRTLGKNGAWLLDALSEAAKARGVPVTTQEQIAGASIAARYGLPKQLAPLARLRANGVTRGDLMALLHTGEEHRLYDPEVILDTSDDQFSDVLSISKLRRLQQAILVDAEESLNRKKAGHVARASQANIARKLVEDLYVATGPQLEQAIVDALIYVGLSTQRVYRQRNGEEDIRISHSTGTIVVSVTASQDDRRPIRWNKVREVLGTGAGLNPVNYVCIGRPGFQSLAETQAGDIAREEGPRSLLLVPIGVLAESVVRIAEGSMSSAELGNLLARHRGVLTTDDLPAWHSEHAATSPQS